VNAHGVETGLDWPADYVTILRAILVTISREQHTDAEPSDETLREAGCVLVERLGGQEHVLDHVRSAYQLANDIFLQQQQRDGRIITTGWSEDERAILLSTLRSLVPERSHGPLSVEQRRQAEAILLHKTFNPRAYVRELLRKSASYAHFDVWLEEQRRRLRTEEQ
jgi:hypothetical protein